jgi:hypothetical protein
MRFPDFLSGGKLIFTGDSIRLFFWNGLQQMTQRSIGLL